jgi:diadenylate cyclase
MRPADILDIAFISVALYFTLLWLKQQASRSLAVALGIALVVYVLARQTDMYLTSQLFRAGLTAVLVSLVLIFHTDIRRIFERLAAWRLFSSKHGLIASNYSVDILTESIAKLAEDRVGALIVIKGLEPLDRHVRGGVVLNGKISAPLLYGLFITQSPTHDGAVIVEGESMERFGVYLPLSQNVSEGGRAGTRHAAALGLSERSDALVVVVSEERGTIGVAEHGKLDKLESAVNLKGRLQAFYQRMRPSKGASRSLGWFAHNTGIKAAALLIAVGLWWAFSYRVTTVHRTFAVPIEYRNLPHDYVIDDAGAGVSEARVSLSGPERNFSFDPLSMAIAVDLGAVRDGPQEVPITEQSLVNKPSGLSVDRIMPRTLRVKADRMTAVELPVTVTVAGLASAQKGVRPGKLHCDPSAVRILVPRSHRSDYSTIATEPLGPLDARNASGVRVNLVLPDHAQFVDGKQLSVIVTADGFEKK